MAEKSNINPSSSSNYQATSFIKFANILHKTNELAIIQDYFNFYGQVDALKCSFDCSKMKKYIDFKYTFLFKYSIPFFFFSFLLSIWVSHVLRIKDNIKNFAHILIFS